MDASVHDLLSRTQDEIAGFSNTGPRTLEVILKALDQAGFHAEQPKKKCKCCGKSIQDAIVFELPIEGIEYLRLKLSAKGCKEEGEFRFEILKTTISQE